MEDLLSKYAKIVGKTEVDHIVQLGAALKGMKVVHVNSTRAGGGVAEILNKIVPLMAALGIDARWEVISGSQDFFKCTKGFHNALQGMSVGPSQSLLETYEKTNRENAEKLAPILREADFVFIHDPQPAAILDFAGKGKAMWVWRCHIDVSRPFRPVWKYLRRWVAKYDASIFSLPEFAQPLPHPQYLIPPSIDPLSEKNMELPENEIKDVFQRFGLDPGIPLVLQVSRFDRFKDPVGVIAACRLARELTPLQLVLAGGGATDDPEGDAVLREVELAAKGDPHIHVLVLPSNAHRTINALQRAADIVMQKSTREGFGLTVSEAMWKGKPVIGGDTGGIRIQVIDHFTGFRVKTPEGAALRIRYLLHRRDRLEEMGRHARRFVLENFLITRHLREYLSLMHGLLSGVQDRIMVPR